MDTVLTMPEIAARFDGEWILVGDPEIDEHNEVVSGTVLWHSTDRDAVYQKAKELRPKRSAFLYTGPNPENVLINL